MRKLLILSLLAASWITTLGATEYKVQSHTFTLPDGFTIEVAAGQPLVDRPIVADFDEEGRLYVADSSGSNDKVEKQLAEKPHRIVRLEDADGDGRFDRSVVFAAGMMFPEGTLWLDGSLYVAAPPSIWKLTDSDGDGVTDQREEWFQGKTLTGCANDLHGPYAGPDGWIYWCKGAFAKQTYERPGKQPFVTRASHIFRRRPGGGAIEHVMTGGMDNPVDVAFTLAGERIFTTTFFEHPGGGKRDGLVHAIYGGVYGKSHDVLDDHIRTGDLMPVLTHLGPAAPCGLTRYASRAFGEEYQDNLFASLFNLHKVTRHVLVPDGPTFRARDSDFVVSDNTDFHPTDVLEDADGSLLVVDTGGWYKLCCPTSQLAKPDVLGSIYRIRRKDAAKPDDPRGRKVPWADLVPENIVKLLGDSRPRVRERAIQQIAKRGAASVPLLAAALKPDPSISAEARLDAVWALTRIDAPSAREAVRQALADSGETVRHAAVHSAGLWRDVAAAPPLEALLETPSLQVRRAAAEALGRIGSKTSVQPLLAAAGARLDRALEHSLTYALIEIADPLLTSRGLEAPSPFTKRAALIALDQMEGGALGPAIVKPFLNSEDPLLKGTASWIISHRPAWGGALAGHFRDCLVSTSSSAEERGDLEAQLARLAKDGAIQGLLSSTLRDTGAPRTGTLVALHAMRQAGLKETPPAWTEDVTRLLASGDPDLVREAVQTVRSFSGIKDGAAGLAPALLRVARSQDTGTALRVEALAGVPGGLAAVEAEDFVLLRGAMAASEPVLTRAMAAGVLAKAKLSREQLQELIRCLKDVGPLEAPQLFQAFEKSPDEALGLELVSALRDSAASSWLRSDALKPLLAKFPESVRKEGETLFALLDEGAVAAKARLEDLLGSLKDGDVRRGQAVFNSPKAACSACHAIGYLGGKIGPDLTRIGQVRSERDLLEALIYPSVSFVRSYEPVEVLTSAGGVFSGVLKKDSSDEVILVTGVDKEVRIARADITEMRAGSVSIMPQGLETQLSTQDIADLLAFLRATRW